MLVSVENKMRLQEAQSVVRECQGKSYTWLKSWGMSTISEAIRTIMDRKSATEADIEYALDIQTKVARRY